MYIIYFLIMDNTTVLYLLYVRLSICMDFRQLFIFSRLNKLTCAQRLIRVLLLLSIQMSTSNLSAHVSAENNVKKDIVSWLSIAKIHHCDVISSACSYPDQTRTNIRSALPVFGLERLIQILRQSGSQWRKQHQLICWKFSTATPVHCKLQKRSESKFRVLSQVSFHKVVGNVVRTMETMETEKCRSFVV